MSTQTSTAGRNRKLDDAVAEAKRRYSAARPGSGARHHKATQVMPGGNTRAVLYYPPFPITMVQGEGARLTDIDGNVYIDFVSEYGAGILGHSNPHIFAAARKAMDDGMALGAPNRYEAELARLFVERFPAMEMVRFCNSGTEANLMAISAVRASTGRSKVLAFRDGYHGGILTFAHGGSELNVPFDWAFADYNDVDGTAAVIRSLGSKLACVIVEPMMGGAGCLPGTPEFLRMLRAETRGVGACLIFDEIITSRLGPGGVHGLYGITPDIMTGGKYLAGGFAFGAFGGDRRIMARFDPSNPEHFSHGGTFNNNVVAMASGVAVLTKVFTPEVCTAFNARGDRLRQSLAEIGRKLGVPLTVTGLGSAMNVHFQAGPIDSPRDVDHHAEDKLTLYYLEMMNRSIYVTPRGMINLNIELTEADCAAFTQAFEAMLTENIDVMR